MSEQQRFGSRIKAAVSLRRHEYDLLVARRTWLLYLVAFFVLEVIWLLIWEFDRSLLVDFVS